MNWKQKVEEKKRVISLFSNSYPEGCIKITSQESELHARVKTQLAHYLKSNDYHIWTEVSFKQPFEGRADILALHKSGISFILEVVCSEKEKSLLRKAENYPLPLIIVDAKNFKYEEFCL